MLAARRSNCTNDIKFIRRCLCMSSVTRSMQRSAATSRMHSIGQSQPVKTAGEYEAGQCFIHKVFAYRGLVLFPYTAEVHDFGLPLTAPTPGQIGRRRETDFYKQFVESRHPQLAQPRTQTYYQTLIHTDDWQHIRMQTNHVLPFLSSIESQNMTSAEGVDHVAHDEMMPYRSSEDPLVDHKLFHHLFSQQQTAPTGRRQHVAAHMYAVRTEHVWQPTDKLTKWHNRQKLMLNASNVYRETTKDVRVTVMPFFIGSSKRLNETTYWWRYILRIELMGDTPITVRGGKLTVYARDGQTLSSEVRGVNSVEPILTTVQRAYQIVTNVSMKSAGGHAWGTLKLERHDPAVAGRLMQLPLEDVAVPNFHLEAIAENI